MSDAARKTDDSSARRVPPMTEATRRRLRLRLAAHVKDPGFQRKLAEVRQQVERDA